MKGYVYFIQINGMQPIKIGYTTDPKGTDRFDSAKTYAPFGVTYVANIPSSNASKLERELHEKFGDKRLNGEWFDISQAQAYKIAMQYGGNAGAPTLDVEFFTEMHSEDHTMIELPLRVQQWYNALPNSFTIDFLLYDKDQAVSNEAANIIKQATVYKWVKRLRYLKLIEDNRMGKYIKTTNKLPFNVHQWYEELPIKFTRKIFTEKTHFENLKKYNIGNPNSGKLCRLLADRNLFLKEPIKGGHYIKTQLQ
jgi:hypothetical protein